MYGEIIGELESLDTNSILKIVLSKSKQGIQRATVRPIMLKGIRCWQLEKIIGNQAFHSNVPQKDLSGLVLSLLEDYEFANVNFILNGRTVSFAVTKKKKLFRSESKTAPANEIGVSLTHDKKKKYILEEGMPIQPLVDLGVFDKDFRVVKSKSDKFRQINRFTEVIADEFEDCENLNELNIIDFGCGKSYLTFIIYYYFTEIKKMKVNITGYDLKADVVAHCNSVAEKYKYEGIRFIAGDISQIEKQAGGADMIITLHACDTATDYALSFAVKNKVRHIFSVPCCQHEVNAQISRKDEFSVLLRHGLYKERFSAILTDAIRCEILSGYGYDVDVIELVGFENTPKNAMIRAKLTGKQKTPGKNPGSNSDLEKLAKDFNINPTLMNLLRA